MLPAITARVPQGIGDQLWVLRYLLPQAKTVHLKVIDPGGLPPAVARRAAPVLAAVPGVGTVEYVPWDPKADDETWLRVQQPLTPVISALRSGDLIRGNRGADRTVTWCANPGLEAGRPLETLDPALPVKWDLGLPVARANPLGFLRNDYLCVYVSGDAVRHRHLCERVWPVRDWVTFADRVAYNAGVGTRLPVVVVGAGFDRPAGDAVAAGLTGLGFAAQAAYDLPLPKLLRVLADAACFLGYQSGLNVLAEEVGARQHMMYFPRVAPMGEAFVRPARRGTPDFTWCGFDAGPHAAALLPEVRFTA